MKSDNPYEFQYTDILTITERTRAALMRRVLALKQLGWTPKGIPYLHEGNGGTVISQILVRTEIQIINEVSICRTGTER